MSTSKPTPIGLIFPLQRGSVGYFDQSFDSFTAYRMNIINLIRTKPGERRMNPTFGCKLWNFVFEPNDSFLPDKIEKAIKDDVNRWIPGVSVASVSVKYFENDTSTDLRDVYKLYITVIFIINAIKQEDVVEIVLDINKI